MRFRALMARAISQMASVMGVPMIKIRNIAIRFTLQQPRSLMPRSVQSAAGSWQAAMDDAPSLCLISISRGDNSGLPGVAVN